jgi:hypothetical protein
MPLFLPWRARPPTEGERNVLFWIVVAIFVGFGLVCLYFGYRAPPEKAQEAAKAIRGGYGFIAVGVVIWAVRRFFSGYSE